MEQVSFEAGTERNEFHFKPSVTEQNDLSSALVPVFIKERNVTTHWVNLRLTIHAQTNAIEIPSGACTVHV